MIVVGPDELLDLPEAWPVTSTAVLASGQVAQFVQDQVTTPNGELIAREYIQHPGAVGVIALDEDLRMALVRQYRHPVRHRLIEPPAGLLDVEGEDHLLTARRELAEEVGLAATSWRVLVDLFTTPGMVSEALRIYLARDLGPVSAPDGFARHGEEAHMDTVWAALADVVDAILDGRLHNPTVVAGALAAWTALQRDGFESLRPPDAPWPARDPLRAS